MMRYISTRHGSQGSAAALSFEEIKQLQQILVKKGYDVGDVDGKIGKSTRIAVKDMQQKLGLPADSYPDKEFFQRLAGG